MIMDVDVIDQISQLVNKYNENPTSLEMEVRLGQRGISGFEPGVTFSGMGAIDAILRRSRQFESTPWQEEHIFYYTDTDGVEKRTIVVFDTETLGGVTKVTQCKTRLAMTEVPCGLHTLRFVLSEETVTRPLSCMMETNLMAIRQRTSHTLMRDDVPYMRYDISKRWTGRSKTDAEASKSSGVPPRCEIEIELVRVTNNYTHTAHSMLLKARDLISKVEADQAPDVYCR